MNYTISKRERERALAGRGLRILGDRALGQLRAGRNVHELCRETGLRYGDMRAALIAARLRENEHEQATARRYGP